MNLKDDLGDCPIEPVKLSYQFATNANIEEAFEEEAESLPLQLAKGVRAEMKWTAFKEFGKLMSNMVLEDDRVLTLGLMGVAPKLLFKINGNLDIELEEEDLKALLETPMAQIANVNLNQLVSSVSSIGEFSHVAYYNEELKLDEDDEEIESVEEILDALTKTNEEDANSFMDHPKWEKMLVWLVSNCVGDSMEMRWHYT